MAEPVTIRLSVLPPERVTLFVVDIAVVILLLIICLPQAVGIGGPGAVLLSLVPFVVAVLVDVAQAKWLCQVTFDDEGVTITRLWVRQRVYWRNVRGLVYRFNRRSNEMAHELRLVLVGSEPLTSPEHTWDEVMASATGPVVMTLTFPRRSSLTLRAQGARDCVFQELESRGFPRPKEYSGNYQPGEWLRN